MKKRIRNATKKQMFVWGALVLIALAQCGDALPVANPVQSVELNALDAILSANHFNGLVVFIASWCPPCKKELPDLAQLYRKYKKNGLSIVAISVDQDPEAVQPLINKLKIPFPVYWAGAKGIEHYKLVGVPTLLVVGKGAVLEKLPGIHRKSTLERKIRKLIF